MTLVTLTPCWLCGRDCDETYVLVDTAEGIQAVCGPCWEKRDTDYLDERLDMTEDEA